MTTQFDQLSGQWSKHSSFGKTASVRLNDECRISCNERTFKQSGVPPIDLNLQPLLLPPLAFGKARMEP